MSNEDPMKLKWLVAQTEDLAAEFAASRHASTAGRLNKSFMDEAAANLEHLNATDEELQEVRKAYAKAQQTKEDLEMLQRVALDLILRVVDQSKENERLAREREADPLWQLLMGPPQPGTSAAENAECHMRATHVLETMIQATDIPP
mmetsp:Transcript_35111/g.111612  ORF Transcript_35111/g.111612 Transcript_35111/m.111612 type:complete len:147 (-) Transcript_35111:115-555(-)